MGHPRKAAGDRGRPPVQTHESCDIPLPPGQAPPLPLESPTATNLSRTTYQETGQMDGLHGTTPSESLVHTLQHQQEGNNGDRRPAVPASVENSAEHTTPSPTNGKRPSHPGTRSDSSTASTSLVKCMRQDLHNLHHSPEQLQHYVNEKVQVFSYKKKPEAQWNGRALHVACLQPSSDPGWYQDIPLLLKSQADVHQFCEAGGTMLLPLHLAAGSNNAGIVKLLCEARAEVDKKSKVGDSYLDHFTALHEAAYFGNLKASEALIEMSADVNCWNKHNQTALHIVARACSGECVELATLLVKASTDLSLRDNPPRADPNASGETCLTTATMSSFPRSKLHVLSRKTMQDVLEVAKLDPESAADLTKDTNTAGNQGEVQEKWRKSLSSGDEAATVDQLVQLLEMAPSAAAGVLEVLSIRPDPDKEGVRYFHPLPNHTQPEWWVARRCVYGDDCVWTCHGEQGKWEFPQWHYELFPEKFPDGAPKKPRLSFEGLLDFGYWAYGCAVKLLKSVETKREHTSEEVRVLVKVLQLPNIVDIHLVYQLTRCDWIGIFSNEAIRALLDHAWMQIVRRHYSMHCVYRALELFVLILLAMSPPTNELLRDAAWSFLCTTSMREICMEYVQVRAYLKRLHRVWSYLTFDNLLDLCSIAVFATLILLSYPTRDFFHPDYSGERQLSRGIMAIVCFLRWVQILYMMRAFGYRRIGIKIVPLFQSFFDVLGISFVTLLLFCAITHAFTVLDPIYDAVVGPTFDEFSHTVLQAYRMLFAGDGDGISYMLGITGHEDGTLLTLLCVVVAYTTFGIFTLNLFIAVHGAAFNSAELSAWEYFYKHRASICLSLMLQPAGLPRIEKWLSQRVPRSMARDPMDYFIILIVVAPVVWIALLASKIVHPAGPSLVLFLFLRLGDRMLLARRGRKDYVPAEGMVAFLWRRLQGSGQATIEPAKEEKMYLWWCGWQGQETRSHNPSVGSEGMMGALRDLSEQVASVELVNLSTTEKLKEMDATLQAILAKLPR